MRSRPHSALAFTLVLAACASSSPVRVRELREFPEFGGWFPIDEQGSARPDWVEPEDSSEARGRWFPPSTREAAEQLLEGRRERAEAAQPWRSLGELLSAPLLLISTPIVASSMYLDSAHLQA